MTLAVPPPIQEGQPTRVFASVGFPTTTGDCGGEVRGTPYGV